MTGAAEGNLPADIATFVGRDDEMKAAIRRLRRARLLTLTGVGGVGKTRLALRIAARLQPAHHGRAWMIDLGPLHDPAGCTPEQLYRHMTLALGIRHHGEAGLDAVLDHLGTRPALLVLDNCESAVHATKICVTELLGAAAHLRILATSRQVLAAEGEHTLLVRPLPPPDAQALFIDRATAAGADPTALADTQLIADLCRRLDGLPLAIRLAAGRARILSLRQLLARLDDRFQLLAETGVLTAGGAAQRHSTLESVVAWSYGLCTPAEQHVWARASVFASSFDLAAAEAVCSGAGIDRADVVDLITGLVDKSVLAADNSRYSLLDTLRDYGLRKLAGDWPRVRTLHQRYFDELVAQAAATWLGPGELDAMASVHQELPNILTAVDTCVTRGQLTVARAICRNLVRVRAPFFWGFLQVVFDRLSRVIDASPLHAAAGDEEAADVAATAAAAAWVAVTQGRHDTAQALLAYAHDALGSRGIATIAPVLFAEGGSHALGAGSPEAIGLLAAARTAFSSRTDTSGDETMATMMWAMATAFAGEPAAAVAASTEHLRNAEAAQAPWAISWALWVAALAALRSRDHERATQHIGRALRLQRDMDDQWGQTWSIELCAWIIAARLDENPSPRGEAERAAWLLGASRARQQKLGVALAGLRPLADAHAHASEQITAALDETAVATAMNAGSRGQAQAVRIALGEPTSRRATAAGKGGLTAREREIAALVAQGLTSPQIGAQLRIGHRTVDVHVGNIMKKVGVRRRAGIATWIATQPDALN